jgi:prepilin-type N-terminal cleavage/methylation domain-containing protein
MIRRRPQRGFSLSEVMIAALLSAFLLLMVSGMWSALGRSMAENVADGHVAADAALALETLRRDLSGNLPGANTGGKQQGRLVGRLVVGGNQLRLCFDGAPTNGEADWTAPDNVVVYELDNGQLVRTEQGTSGVFVAADGVEQFLVTDEGSGVRIELSLSRRGASRTYTFVSQDP